MAKARTVAKAVMGGLVAGLSFAVPVVDDGLAASELLGIALAALVGFQGVYWTSNKGQDEDDGIG